MARKLRCRFFFLLLLLLFSSFILLVYDPPFFYLLPLRLTVYIWSPLFINLYYLFIFCVVTFLCLYGLAGMFFLLVIIRLMIFGLMDGWIIWMG